MEVRLLRRYKGTMIGGIVGGIAGFAYYYYVGCASGTCPISSNPFVSTLYVGTIGALLGTRTKKKKQAYEHTETNSN